MMTPQQMDRMKSRIRELFQGHELHLSQARELAQYMATELLVHTRSGFEDAGHEGAEYWRVAAPEYWKFKPKPPRISK